MRVAKIAALFLGLATPVLALMGCTNANSARETGNTPLANRYEGGRSPWWASRPAYDRSGEIGATGMGRVCTPSDELAVEIVYGRVDGVADTEDGKCSVFPIGARRVDYSVAVANPAQCSREGLAAFGYKLPLKPPVCN